MALKPFPVSGYPNGAEEAVPGSILYGRNLYSSQPGVMKRKVPYTSLLSGLPSNVEFYGIAPSSEKDLVAVWNGLNLGVQCVRVGDAISSLVLGIGGTLSGVGRAGTVFERGVDDLIPSTPFPFGGGVVFNTYPPTAVGPGAGGGARIAGAPRGLDISLSSESLVGMALAGAAYPALGFAPGDSVAYRHTIGYERLNSSGTPVEVLGAPGGRFVYARPTTSTGKYVPKLRVRIPASINDYILWSASSTQASLKAFIYVYRSTLLSADATKALQGVSSVAPTDEMQLVFKIQISQTDISAGFIEFYDMCPIGGEGPPLYTNPTQGGVLVERWQAPLSNAMATFKGTTFRGGINEIVARTTLQIASPPYIYNFPLGTPLHSTGSAFTFAFAGSVAPVITAGMIFSVKGSSITADYIASGTATLAAGTLTVPVTGAPAAGDYSICNAVCGRITIKYTQGYVHSLIGDASLNSSPTGAANKFLVTLPVSGTGDLDIQMKAYVQQIASSICTCINFTGVIANLTIVAANNASGTLDTATIMLELRSNLAAWTPQVVLTVAISGVPTNSWDLASRILPVQDATATVAKNRLMWGPPNIADCVCPSYTLDIGSPYKEIIRIVATKNALYIFKEDGLWMMDGDGSGGNSWTLTEVSSDVIALTPSSIEVFEDSVIVATPNGVLMLSGSAISLLSGNINTEYRDAVNSRIRHRTGDAQYGYFSVSCSYKEQTASICIPTYSSSFLAPVSMIFTYSFSTREWVIESGTTSVAFLGDGNIPVQYIAPLRGRLPMTIQMSSQDLTYGSLDGAQKRVLRLPDPNGLYATGLAVESADTNIDSNPTGAIGDTGTLLPLEDNTSQSFLTYISGHDYYYDAPRPDPENLLATAVNGYVYITGAAVYSKVTAAAYVSDATPRLRLKLTITEGSPGQYAGAYGWLCSPAPVEITFSPIGDGRSAFNFNQAGVFQTRQSSAKNVKFTFWLDTSTLFPYTAPDSETVSPIVAATVPRNVFRAGIPARMTRGSRLNIKATFTPELQERIEISSLLMDFDQIAAEEVGY